MNIEEANKKRVANAEKLRRRIELGYVKGKIRPNGVVETNTQKGIQNWYDTRTLVKMVTEQFDIHEDLDGNSVCYINNKWQLQIRGKHLRRLLKAMPDVKQVGRTLVREKKEMKLYIAVLDEFPDYMTPTLVAHAVLGAHLQFTKIIRSTDILDGLREYPEYIDWLENSFKKCVVRVNQKEFDKIAALPNVYLGHENNTLEGRKSCAVVCPMPNEQLTNVLKFAKLWKPKE